MFMVAEDMIFFNVDACLFLRTKKAPKP